MLSVDTLRDSVKRETEPKRLAHVLGCERAAVQLARLYAADENAARAAALLHDITKGLSLTAQLQLLREYDILTDTVELAQPKLLHALTGACVALVRFGQTDVVCSAIRWHTTGRAGMSTLEKIIYLADYIEPTRDFPGVQALRELAEKTLDGAVLLGLEMTIEHVAHGDGILHPDTLRARDWLRSETGK